MLRPAVAATLVVSIAIPVLIGAAFALYSQKCAKEEPAFVAESNPLSVFAAMYLSLIFVAAQYLAGFARSWLGDAGLMDSASLLGSFDIDALVASVAPMIRHGMSSAEAARALTYGITGNSAVKCAATIVWGSGRFRRDSILGFACILAKLAVSITF